MDTTPAVSIILPVYNVERYLAKSLESITRQTFTDYECILVDDGSTDGSGALCDAMAARDSRFVVIHQPNSGLPTARNVGIEAARGKYIGFMDSDDYAHPDMYKVLFECITATQADLAACQYFRSEKQDDTCFEQPPVELKQ